MAWAIQLKLATANSAEVINWILHDLKMLDPRHVTPAGIAGGVSFPRVAWRAPQPLLPPQLAREPRSSCRFRSATLFPPQAPQAVASDEEYEMQHLGSHTTVEGQYWKMHAAGRQYSLRRRISLGTCDRGKDSRKKSAGAGAAAGVAAAAEATAAAAPAPGTGLPQVSPQAELTERAACPERMQ
jgi:hypothetical protein